MRQSFEESADPSFGRKHLPLLRAEMARQGLDGFLVPHEDEHQNEYLPDANDRLAWLTGFTGSAGAAVVLKDKAAVFVDGRYTLQVREQVDAGLFEIRDLVEGGVPAYLESAPNAGQLIGYDPRLHSPDALHWLKAAAARAGARLHPVDVNPLDLAWGEARPAQPKAPIVPHPIEYSGEGSADKRRRLGETLGADAAVITAAPSIAWLFNVRGGDVRRAPMPLGQTILSADGTARLFLDPDKLTPDLQAWLGNAVSLEHPDALPDALDALKGKRVLVDPSQSSDWYFDRLSKAGAEVVRGMDPCALPRAAKNAVEVEGARRAHARDGIAMARFLYWLATEGQVNPPDEIEATIRLEGLRDQIPGLKDTSFDTIAGALGNAALCHYHPSHKTNQRAKAGTLFLVDSGGQYLDGTTDITRTVAIGEPDEEMRDRFTRVLKGHIALARAVFPAGTSGSALDALARLPLWQVGLDYDHGTGHGVGSYLSVHEGPHRISKAPNNVGLRPGMIVSNEPGFYKAGEFGIRIENLQVVTEAQHIPGGERPMMSFETLTVAPIDRRLIDRDLLEPVERAWLDAYHAKVVAVVGPNVEPEVRTWLEEVCAPI